MSGPSFTLGGPPRRYPIVCQGCGRPAEQVEEKLPLHWTHRFTMNGFIYFCSIMCLDPYDRARCDEDGRHLMMRIA